MFLETASIPKSLKQHFQDVSQDLVTIGNTKPVAASPSILTASLASQHRAVQLRSS